MYYDSNELSDDQSILSYGLKPDSVLTLTESELTNEVADTGSEKSVLSTLCDRVSNDKRLCSELVKSVEEAINDLQTFRSSSSSEEEKIAIASQLKMYMDAVSELKGSIDVFRSKYLFLLNEIQSMHESLTTPQEPSDNQSVSSASSMQDTHPEDLLNLPGMDALQDYQIVLQRRDNRAAIGAHKPEVQTQFSANEEIPAEHVTDAGEETLHPAGEAKEGERHSASLARPTHSSSSFSANHNTPPPTANHPPPTANHPPPTANHPPFSTLTRATETTVDELVTMNDGDLAIDAMDHEDGYNQEEEECNWDEAGDEEEIAGELDAAEHPPRIYNIADDSAESLEHRSTFERRRVRAG